MSLPAEFVKARIRFAKSRSIYSEIEESFNRARAVYENAQYEFCEISKKHGICPACLKAKAKCKCVYTAPATASAP
jgi:hypothetical protein